MRFLLDTNVLSEPLRPQPDAAVLRRLRTHSDEIAMPSPAWHELHFGCARLPEGIRRSVIERYLDDVLADSFAILGYDMAAAEWHARERARLVGEGATPAFVDGQIAAIARVHDLTVVTFNRRHFEVFSGLTVADWRTSVQQGC